MEFRSFLIKYAEIGVKGRNRGIFEDALVRQIRHALKRCEGEFAVRRTRGRVYVEVLSESYDYEETVEGLKTVFGIAQICPMIELKDEGFESLCSLDYKVEDCPTWVDRVYPADLLVQLYDYHGTLIHGFLNSVLGQKGCLKTTEGYNYLALNDDVWVYTGVTSVSGDRSNVGFVMMNQRTKETKYYEIPGAEEYSAMASAEGQVQNLGYKATFPLLLNIADEPTYFIALKDNAGLVKKYAMLNIQKYQNVAIGDTVQECEKKYLKMIKGSGAAVAGEDTKKITGEIRRMAQGVIDGNTHYYIVLEDHEDLIFDVPITDFLGIVKYDVGDRITISYNEAQPANSVVSVEGDAGSAEGSVETDGGGSGDDTAAPGEEES